MARKCDLTGKGRQNGNNVSKAKNRTKKVWSPNLQKKTFMMDGKKVTMKLSTSAIRTLKKKGILTAVKNTPAAEAKTTPKKKKTTSKKPATAKTKAAAKA